MEEYQKDPDSTASYTMNWTRFLVSGETISNSSWEADTGVTVVTDTSTTTTATIWISGGEAGTSYVLTNTITTSDSRIEPESIVVYVEESFGSGPVTSTDVDTYITLSEANTYMTLNKFDKSVWDEKTTTEKYIALNLATKRIDRLPFKGEKSVSTQVLQFPRSGGTSAPQAIKDACAEIAFQLCDGRNPEYEYDDLRIMSSKVGGVSITSDTKMVPQYKVAGIPSPEAWAMLLPYIRNLNTIIVERV